MINQKILVRFVLILSFTVIFVLIMNYGRKLKTKCEIKPHSKPSVFTKIIKRQIPATILYEDDKCIAFLSLSRQTKVKFLVVPLKQIENLEEAQECDETLLGHMMLVAAKLAKQRGATNGYRLVINNGKDALQDVPHLHIHVFGGQKLSWPPGL